MVSIGLMVLFVFFVFLTAFFVFIAKISSQEVIKFKGENKRQVWYPMFNTIASAMLAFVTANVAHDLLVGLL